jgi:hypothetical protein
LPGTPRSADGIFSRTKFPQPVQSFHNHPVSACVREQGFALRVQCARTDGCDSR